MVTIKELKDSGYLSYAAKVVILLIVIPLLLIACVCLYINTLFAQGFGDNSAAFLLSTSTLRGGLVAYWRLEEASGTRYDCSKNGNHLTPTNTPAVVAGIVGNGIGCVNSSHMALTIASNATMSFPSSAPFTIAAWIKPTNAFSEIIIGKASASIGSNTNEYTIGFFSDAKFYFDVSNGINKECFTAATTTNVWHFVVGWYDGVNANITLDNGSTNSIASSGSRATAQQFSIGGYSSSSFTGAVDEVGLWNRVLSAKERTFLYNAGAGTHFPWAHP